MVNTREFCQFAHHPPLSYRIRMPRETEGTGLTNWKSLWITHDSRMRKRGREHENMLDTVSEDQLNHLARRIKSEGSRECHLSWLCRYCKKVGKDPEAVVAADSLWIRESMQDFVDDAGTCRTDSSAEGETPPLGTDMLKQMARRQVVFAQVRSSRRRAPWCPSRTEPAETGADRVRVRDEEVRGGRSGFRPRVRGPVSRRDPRPRRCELGSEEHDGGPEAGRSDLRDLREP